MKNFEKLSNYIEKEKGTLIRKAQITAYMRPTNIVFLHHNFNLEKNGLMVALHEVGHALQPDMTPEKVALEQYYENEVSKDDVKRAVWETEVDAWERGEQLAKDLELDMNWERFEAMKKKGLDSYQRYNI